MEKLCKISIGLFCIKEGFRVGTSETRTESVTITTSLYGVRLLVAVLIPLLVLQH